MDKFSTQPLVSIGMPVYNGSKYIKRALESLLSQSYANFELLISDNHSTDNTLQIVGKYKDRRIRLYKQIENTGPADNFNFVLEKARGKYFMWASDDDIWNKNYIQSLVNALIHNQSSVLAVCNIHQVNGNFKYSLILPFRKHESAFDALRMILVHPKYGPAIFYGIYRTDILKKADGMHRDSRPMFGGVSDGMTVFKTLLWGDLAYVNDFLFTKNDSGMYLTAYKALETLDFGGETIVRMMRFLKLPLMFVYDLGQMSYYLWLKQPVLSFSHKCVLEIYVLYRFVSENVRHTGKIMRGIAAVLTGLIISFKYKFKDNRT